MTTTADKPYVLRASIDSRSLPIELFGSGRSRHQRKLIFNYICSYANPDGTSACPSLTTIAKDNGFSRRGAINIVQWLLVHGLLRKDSERSRFNTNKYACLFSAEDQERCRTILRAEAEAETQKKIPDGELQRAPSIEEMVHFNVHQPLVNESMHQGSARREQMVHDGEGDGAFQRAHDRPSLPSINRHIPSFLPSRESDGRKDGALASEYQAPRTSKDLAGDVGQWMSDLIYAKTDKEKRHIPSMQDERRIETLLIDFDPGEVVAAFYRFCLRPLGVYGLVDVFGMWWKECGQHLADARRELGKKSLDTVLTDLHDEVLDDDAVDCKNHIYQILGLEQG